MLAQVAAEQPQQTADFLQREALAAEGGHREYFEHLLRSVTAAMVLFKRGDHFALIEPLQLPQAHAGHAGDIAAEKYRLCVGRRH